VPRVHTHYDNLKVARDAPIEVIRAAYRSLSGMYHPDRHPGSDKAARIMRIINTSYGVISDPALRAQHDRWIASMEFKPEPTSETSRTPWPEGSRRRREHYEPQEEWEPVSTPPSPIAARPFNPLVGLGALLAILIAIMTVVSPSGPSSTNSTSPKPSPAQVAEEPPVPKLPSALPPEISARGPARKVVELRATPSAQPKLYDGYVEAKPPVYVVATPRFVRPSYAPNGEPWPTRSGYMSGFDQLSGGGRSNLTVDNSKGGSDTVVSVFDHTHDRPMRVFFLLAHDKFTAAGLLPGYYDVRYMDLSSGLISRSEPIQFREVRDQKGISWHDSTVTLYGERDPEHPIHFEKIGPSEFVKLQPRQ
jgi:hypothetical protein